MKNRLDSRLVADGFYLSRAKAVESIKNGMVLVNGKVATKPSVLVGDTDTICASPQKYVSRAAKKLEHALKVFDLNVSGKTAIDVGASTGGFSQVLLENGAKKIYAVDVGTNQLSPIVADDLRVVSLEQTNFLHFMHL